MTTLFLIPARGGSKGLPGKNLREVAGMSLVARAIRLARQFIHRHAPMDAVVLVDTDAREIAEEAGRWGAPVPFLRSAHLAEDTTPTIDSALHALDRVDAMRGNVGTVVLLQPTSPMRTLEDLEACWHAYQAGGRQSAITVTPVTHPAEFMIRLGADAVVHWVAGDPRARRRQETPQGFVVTGAVYISGAAFLRERRSFVVPGVTRGVTVPASRSVDIDTSDDLLQAEGVARTVEPKPVALGDRWVGPGYPCLVIAEAGVNHNGDVALAHQLVDVAGEAGADAVKFQTFNPDRVTSRSAATATYQRTETADETQHEMLRRLVLPLTTLEELRDHAHALGLMFLSTPFDDDSADRLEQLGMAAFKVPSGELTNHPFLAHLAGKGRPLLISTGMADMTEVAAALDIVDAAGGPPVVLLHCVTSYPADPAHCNLRAMDTMRAAFGVPTGWSDHTAGIHISTAAVALGASVLEKHFTLDRNLPGPDHNASLEPGELRQLVAAVRAIESARGDGQKRPVHAERELAQLVRRSLHAAHDLEGGHLLASEDLVALRPGGGVAPSRLAEVVGRRLRYSVRAGQMIVEADLG